MAEASYHFLSFVRSGFAAAITQPDTFGSAQPALATAPVGLTVSGVPQPVEHRVVVRGPGDIIGLFTSQVVRTDPVDGAVGVEPNYFAQIELDRPDLPWLFTPAAAVGERLRPWIVLLVLDGEGPAGCKVREGAPLPVVSVSTEAAKALPDLADSYLWAHAQVILPAGMSIEQALADGADPRLTISRLMCPRHLEPNRWYVAAVVPAFNVGRLAGLGQDVTTEDEAKLEPAWQPGGAVDLPVFHSWRFRTGEEADFERLARQLKGNPLPEGVGVRALDVSRPGAGLPAADPPADVHDTTAIAWLEGALRPIDSDRFPARDPAATQAFQASLTVLLDRPADLVLAGQQDPVIAPPIYGDKHALVVKLDGTAVPPWIAELNLDPRNRVAAGLGTQVIQDRQEDLVARAWRQLGDVLRANRLLRAAQLARTSSLRVHARLASLDPASMVTLAYPVQDRIVGVLDPATTLGRAVRASRLPDASVQPAFRRMARSSAAVGRAAGLDTLVHGAVERFASELFTAPTAGPDGATAMRPAVEVIGADSSAQVLMAMGDAQPSETGRLDTVVSTLNASLRPLPGGDELRAVPAREDIGAVSIVTSLGAVPAAAVSAVVGAAVVPGPPPPPPVVPPVIVGPVPPHPPVVPPVIIGPGPIPSPLPEPIGGPVVHLPMGLAGGAGAARARELGGVAVTPVDRGAAIRGGIVFQPPGPTRPIGDGAILRGGRIVIDNDTIRHVVRDRAPVREVDDSRWMDLTRSSRIPAPNEAADPVSDPGNRLNAFRRDPAAVKALAQVADGSLAATLTLDSHGAALVTSGAAAGALASLASGTFTPVVPAGQAQVTGPEDLVAGHDLVLGAAAALDRMVDSVDAPPAPAAPGFDLAAAKAGLLARLDPTVTVFARVRGRLDVRAIQGVVKRDELDPVMACPQLNDPMWKALHGLGPDWLLPGLSLVPPDTVTVVRTNPGFVAAHMVGLNHEMMRELLWREYPTDQRGTPFHRFWGRLGEQPDDIGPVHGFSGALTANLLAGRDGETVLLMRSELLRRYQGSIIYMCRARQSGDDLVLDDGTIVLPSFRGDLPPDVSFVGFPLAPEALRDTGDPWWFVIAQPPAEPRFGLDEPAADTPGIPTSANQLAWSHMATNGPGSPTPFALADPPVLRGHPIDAVTWGASAAVQAHLTYQHSVRVAIRAAPLLPPTPGGPT